MGRNCLLENGKTLTIYLEKDQIDHLKKIALRLSAQQNALIGMSEVIRDALYIVYPYARQQEMFAKKKLRKPIDAD